MKQISKRIEPRSLVEHRANGGTFDNLSKDDLRNSLLVEQGHICCYCMKRIPQKLKAQEIEKHFPSSKIEHVKCQSKPENSKLTLDYKNLLLACNGNHGLPKKMQTCDTYKDERDLSFNPANSSRNIEDLINYNLMGEISSKDEFINADLNEILNLNTNDLKNVRKAYYKDIMDRIILEGRRQKGKDIQKLFYKSEKEKLLRMNDGKFAQYCMIGVYLINKKLKKFPTP